MIDIDKLIKDMTIKEKIGQLTLSGSFHESTKTLLLEGRIGSLLNIYGAKAKEVQRLAIEKTRLGIPLLIGDDVIHGYRTTFPISIGEACTWHPELSQELAHLSKLEASREGINWIYAPMCDITFDPRWGRIMETSGEDPYLGSLFARAKVKGIQTPLPNGNVVASCPKHFLGYGAVEAGLDYNTTEFSEYRMRNLYLPPFQAAIQAGSLTLMTAFTTYNDHPVTSNQFLLREVLRKECQFNGVVVSDWASIEQIVKHGVAKDREHAAELALRAGIDIDMHSDTYLEHLEQVIENNEHLMQLLDEAVIRVLALKQKMGLFEHPYGDEQIELDNAYLRKKARQAADESIILLKNEKNLLPIKNKEKKVLVIGPFVDDCDVHLGAWACKGIPQNVVSIKEGLKSTDMNVNFFPLDLNAQIDQTELSKAVDNCDIILVTLGEPRRFSGEKNNRQSIDLPFKQDEFIDLLASYHKPIVAIVLSGRPLAVTNLTKKCDSIVWCYHLGVEAGNSIASVLTGSVNPSGKTVSTFPKTLGQVPIYYNRYSTGRMELWDYVDGDLDPLFPFGFGLHYTNIKYHEATIESRKNNKVNVTVLLENEGTLVTTEITQVYVSSKYNEKLRPTQQLCGFKRIELLPNEKRQEEIEIDLSQFFSIHELEKGLDLEFLVGPSSNEGITSRIKIKEVIEW